MSQPHVFEKTAPCAKKLKLGDASGRTHRARSRGCAPRSTAARTSVVLARIPSPWPPLRRGFPFLLRGRVPVRALLTREWCSTSGPAHSLRAASTASWDPHAALCTIFFHAITSFSTIHAHSWCSGCQSLAICCKFVPAALHAGCALNRGSPPIAKPSSQSSRANQDRHHQPGRGNKASACSLHV